MQKNDLTKAGIAKDFMSDKFINAATSDKYGSRIIGGGGSVDEGTVLTVNGVTFVDNLSPIDESTYNGLSDGAKRNCTPNGDGTYTQDNSYYAVATSGCVGSVSFTSLVSYNKYFAKTPQSFQDRVKALNEANIIAPTPGSIDIVAAYLSKTFKGQTGGKMKLAARHIFKKDEPHPLGYKNKEGNILSLGYDIRCDVWVKEGE